MSLRSTTDAVPGAPRPARIVRDRAPLLPVLGLLATPAVALAQALATPPDAAADRASAPPAQALADVIVAATRFPESIDRLPIGATVIDAEEIARSGARTLPDLLAMQPGIAVRNFGGSPDAQVDLRGFGADTGYLNTLVLLDGHRLNENEQAPVPWGAIPLESIERIEILRGAGAVAFGSGATGGTINIVTRAATPGPLSGSVRTEIGSHGARELGAAVGGGSATVAWSLRASTRHADNWRRNNALDQDDVQGTIAWRTAAGRFELRLLDSRQSLDLPGTRTLAQLRSDARGTGQPNDMSATDNRSLSVGWSNAFGGVRVEVDATHREREYEVFYDGPYGGFARQAATIDSLSPRVSVPWTLAGIAQRTIAGVDAERWSWTRRTGASSSDAALDRRALVADESRTGAWLIHHVELGERTRLQAGARRQFVDTTAITTPDEIAVQADASRAATAWDLALIRRLDGRWTASARVARSFRAPTIDEQANLMAPGFTTLRTQRSDDREIGLMWQGSGASVKLTAYEHDLKDEIKAWPAVGETWGSNLNLPASRRQGLEAATRFTLTSRWTVGVNATLQRSEVAGGMLPGGKALAQGEVPLVPRVSAQAFADWRFADRTRARLAVRHVGRQRYDADYANTEARMAAYTVTDLRLQHDARDWSAAVGVRNLADQRYWSYASNWGGYVSGYPEPGRTVYASGTLRF